MPLTKCLVFTSFFKSLFETHISPILDQESILIQCFYVQLPTIESRRLDQVSK